ncbi:MAG: NAD(P)H-dependent oxidoreductase [Chloroflexia bacterium]|nr:NAD(P)H-dependent oxidoreductase [Chloroflexia bacterium]
MRLTVFNGSPRGRQGDTQMLLETWLDGYMDQRGNVYEILYLQQRERMAQFQQAFAQTEYALLAFPLSMESMPGLVKAFIETLLPLRGWKENPALGFIVHFGLPEALHARPLEKYLRKLSAHLGCRYLGTVIRGGIQELDRLPKQALHQQLRPFRQLGASFGQSGQLDPDLLQQLAHPERLPSYRLLAYRLIQSLWPRNRRTHSYWDPLLRENGAFADRFERPYE